MVKRKVWQTTIKHKALQRCYKEQYRYIVQLREKLERLPLTEAIDIGFLLREMGTLSEDLRKELGHLRELLERIVCIKWIAHSLNDPSKAQPIRGELATGSPDVKQAAALPREKDNPAAYAAFMSQLGVSGDALNFSLVRPHWPAMMDYFSALAEKGKPLPRGINVDKTYPIYKVTFRRRKVNDSKGDD